MVISGGAYFTNAVREKLQDHMVDLELEEMAATGHGEIGVGQLSAREKEIFILLADSLTPKEVATRLFISPKTVETHKYNIMEKLNISSLAQFTKIAVKKGLINI